MAGHSKWKNNLHRKSAQDAKRSVNFGKLSRAITIAVMEGASPDPATNPRLRVAIEKAKAGSMPKDNIERAIAKGSGPDKAQLQSLRYELFGPAGVVLLALATTDNPNRTNGEIRTLVERNGGKVGMTGSVSHLFTHCAAVALPTLPEEAALTLAGELEALDIEQTDEHTWIYFPFQKLGKASEIVAAHQITPTVAPQEIYRPLTVVSVDDAVVSDVEHLLELLDSHDDIQEVFTNIV